MSRNCGILSYDKCFKSLAHIVKVRQYIRNIRGEATKRENYEETISFWAVIL